MSLEYRIGTIQDSEAVYEFLLNHFRVTEPITTSLGATVDDVVDFFADLRDDGLKNATNSIVVYSNDELVAICLNNIKQFKRAGDDIENNIDPYEDYAKKISSGPYVQHKANQLVSFVETVEEHLDTLLGYPEQVFKMDVLCVRKDYHGQGIAHVLVDRSFLLAQQAGCSWVATTATAVASQGLFKKCGFSTIRELPFSCFRENTTPVYSNLPDGGRSAKLMAFHLQPSQTDEDDDDLK